MFDEQPSPRDVYGHEIPWLYARRVKGLKVSGRFLVEESLREYVKREEILEACEESEIVSCR